ncbi:MAG: hypothetical protein DHS20C10_09740 [marine bacterium B5-7]|nr:MAG: hypothetical protein DHS20C10_09740 [marine bacterium B5-7]
MYTATACFVLGFLSVMLSGIAIPAAWLPASVLVILASFYCRQIRWLAIILFSASYLSWYIHQRSVHKLPDALMQSPQTVTGVVRSFPSRRRLDQRFVFEVPAWHAKLWLHWYGYSPTVRLGETWQLRIRLKPVYQKPTRFDYAHWLYSQGYTGTGQVLMRAKHHFVHENRDKKTLSYWRLRFSDSLFETLWRYQSWGFLQALVLGNRQEISYDLQQAFRKTGTSHLIAISGLHVGLMAGLCFFFLRWFWCRSSRLMLFVPANIAAAIGACLLSLGYALLSGWGVPAQRAWIMFSVLMLSTLTRRQVRLSVRWCLALWLVLLCHPLSIMQVGTWLSFFAVAVLIMSGSFVKKHALFKMQGIMCLSMLPINLFCFHRTATFGFVANLFAIPWMSFIGLPLSLLTAVWCWSHLPGAQSMMLLTNWSLLALSQGLSWLAAVTPFSMQASHLSMPVLGLSTLSLLWLCLPRGWPQRWWGLMGALCLFATIHQQNTVKYAINRPIRHAFWTQLYEYPTKPRI